MLKTFTNTAAEPMSVRLRSGVLAWVQPGQTRELDVHGTTDVRPEPAKAKRKR